MRERLEIGRQSVGATKVYARLADLLALLPSRATKSRWTVEPFADRDHRWFEFVAEHEGPHPLDEVAESGDRISFVKLRVVAAETGQVIWGVFSAYDGGDDSQPWMKLIAYDGGWEVETADDKVKRRIERSFVVESRVQL